MLVDLLVLSQGDWAALGLLMSEVVNWSLATGTFVRVRGALVCVKEEGPGPGGHTCGPLFGSRTPYQAYR